VGPFMGVNTEYIQGTAAVSYNVDGQPLPHADGTPVCGQNEVNSSTVTVSPGNSFPVGTLSFTGCS